MSYSLIPSQTILTAASYYNRPPAHVDFERLMRYRSLLKFLKTCMSEHKKTSRLRRKAKRANGFVKPEFPIDPELPPTRPHMILLATKTWAAFNHMGILADCIIMPVESEDEIPAFEEELDRTGEVEAEIRNSTKMITVAVWREGDCPDPVKTMAEGGSYPTSGEYFDEGLNLHYGVWVSTAMWTEPGDKTVTLRHEDLMTLDSLNEIYSHTMGKHQPMKEV